jgi:hypothetical protein
MVYRCVGYLCPDLMTEILEYVAIKVLVVVDYGLLQDPIMTYNVLLEKFLDGHGGYVGDRPRLNPFHEGFHYHNGGGVIALCWCKFSNDINAPSL